MKLVLAIFKREFAAYFATPLAYVFIVIFLFAMGAFTFYIGRFFETGVASLAIFFGYHVWLYLFLVPAIGMRQIAAINRVFSPSPDQLAHARRLIAAWKASDRGVVVVDGKLIERPVLRAMHRLVAIAERIAERAPS